MLFGVRISEGGLMKKSASMGNILHCSSSSASPQAFTNPGSPISDPLRDSGPAPSGYASDDPNQASCSSSRSERKKGWAFFLVCLLVIFLSTNSLEELFIFVLITLCKLCASLHPKGAFFLLFLLFHLARNLIVRIFLIWLLWGFSIFDFTGSSSYFVHFLSCKPRSITCKL